MHQQIRTLKRADSSRVSIYSNMSPAQARREPSKENDNANNQTDCGEWIHREQLENVRLGEI